MVAQSVKELPQDRKKIIAKACKALPKDQQRKAAKFADTLFARVPLEDLAQQKPQTLAAMLIGVTEAEKKKGTVLRVDGLEDGQTLVTISMANRPFIVDSVLADISELSAPVSMVAHPVMKKSDTGGLRSLVLVVLQNMSADDRKSLKAHLKETLDQVGLVTSDWQSMLGRLGETIAELRISPPPIPAADIAEAVQFLEWLGDNNFTLMGMREYAWKGDQKTGQLTAVKKSALGILKDPDLTVMTRGKQPVVLTAEIRDFLNSADPLIITKANVKSRVHRRTYLDYIGIKRYDSDGGLAGELRVLGLFTSTAYTKSVMTIPVLRHKANAVLDRFKVDPTGHSGKALINILETWPRDEMFQVDVASLAEFSAIALQLEERPRVRVLSRVDRFDRFVSTIVYVPRERYDSDARIKIGNLLAQKFDGRVSAWFPQFLENGLARVHFIIGRDAGKTPDIDRLELEAEVIALVRSWKDHLGDLTDDKQATDLVQFPVAYQEIMGVEAALGDMVHMERLNSSKDIAVEFDVNGHWGDAETAPSMKLFHLIEAVPLSRRVPMLENMGFHVIEESTFEIPRDGRDPVYLHNMQLDNLVEQIPDGDSLNQRLTDCMVSIWNGGTDDDRFNALVLTA